MSNIHDLIRTHECDDPADTAAAVMDSIGLAKKHRELFFGLLRDECRRLARSATRIAERSNAVGQKHRDTHVSDADGEIMSRAQWLARNTYNGEEYVCVGEMTVDDHRKRAAYLSAMAGGLNRTADRHLAWAEQLEAAGVRCLNELEAAA